MELDAAAPETLEKLKTLDADMDEARQALQAAEDKLEDADEQLREDDQAFAQAVDHLVQAVQEQRELLGTEAGESEQALADLAEKVRGAHQQCQDELAGAQEEVAALEERLHAMEPDVEDVFEQVVQVAAAAEKVLGDVRDQVREAVSQAGAAAARGAHDLHGTADVVQKRVDNLEHYVAGLCVPVLADIAESWGRTVKGVVQVSVAAGAAAAEENLTAVLSAVAEKCREEHTATLDELAALGTRLEGVVQVLGQAAESGGSELLGSSSQELQEARESEAGLGELLEALLRVRQQLASYTFVEL